LAYAPANHCVSLPHTQPRKFQDFPGPCIKISLTFQDQTNFPGLSTAWKFYTKIFRTFQEAWEPCIWHKNESFQSRSSQPITLHVSEEIKSKQSKPTCINQPKDTITQNILKPGLVDLKMKWVCSPTEGTYNKVEDAQPDIKLTRQCSHFRQCPIGLWLGRQRGGLKLLADYVTFVHLCGVGRQLG